MPQAPAPEIRRRVAIGAPPQAVWAALTDSDEAAAWTEDGDAVVSQEPGGVVDLFGGSVAGSVLRSDPPVVLEWRIGGGPPRSGAVVTWRLEAMGPSTLLELTRSGVAGDSRPGEQFRGWDDEWLLPLREWLET